MNLEDHIEEYYEIDNKIKQLTAEKSNSRNRIEDLLKKHWQENEENLPYRYLHLPGHVDVVDYVETLLPEWDLYESTYNHTTKEFEILVRRKPEYAEYSFEGKKYKFSKSVVTPSPKIDWDSLFKDHPEIEKSITKRVVTKTIDENKLDEWIQEHPDDTELLKKYNTAGTSSSRISVKKK